MLEANHIGPPRIPYLSHEFPYSKRLLYLTVVFGFEPGVHVMGLWKSDLFLADMMVHPSSLLLTLSCISNHLAF